MSLQSFELTDTLPEATEKLAANFAFLNSDKVSAVEGKELSSNDYTDADKAKVAAATINSSDSTLLDRGNHTGTQTIATIEGLNEILEEAVGIVRTDQTVTDPGDNIDVIAADQLTRVHVTYGSAVDLYLSAAILEGDARLTLHIEGTDAINIIGGDLTIAITAEMLSEGVNTLILFGTRYSEGEPTGAHIWKVLSHTFGPEKIVGDGSALAWSDPVPARVAIGGMKTGLANGTAVLASTPEYLGQVAVAQDGFLAVSDGTTPGDWTGTMNLGAPITYFTTLNKGGQAGNITAGIVAAEGVNQGGMHTFKVSGTTFVDNVLLLQNTTDNGAGSKGYTTIQMMHADGLRQLAVGIAPDAVGPDYANSAYIETNNDPTTDAPPPIGLYQFQDNGSGGVSHRRIYMDGANKTVTVYGWSNTLAAGPIGLVVDANGKSTFGASTIVAGATVSVGGTSAGVGYVDRSLSGFGFGFTTYADGAIFNILDNQDFQGVQVGSVAGVFYFRPTHLSSAFDLGDDTHRWKSIHLGRTITAGGVNGAQTINQASGSVNFAAAATSLVVTNSLVTTSSIVLATVQTNDATAHSVKAVVAAGSFTLTLNAAATAATKVAFLVLN